MAEQLHARTEAILRRLVRRDAGAHVRKVLAKTRTEDVAAAMNHLTRAEQRRLFRLLGEREFQADLLPHLAEDTARTVVDELPSSAILELIDLMEPDDATDLVELLPDDVRLAVVSSLERDDDDDLTELLAWPSDSAGGIMSNVVFTQPEAASSGEAIAAMQKHHDEFESIFYLYVIDDERRLVGVVPLRQLLINPPHCGLADIMTREVIVVRPTDDQEDVARLVARYDLLAVPVVDEDRRLLGIVTIDDVVDVLREEAAEDMMRMAGVHEDLDVAGRSVFRLARQRAGWLLATSFAGVVADILTHWLGEPLPLEVLAGFIPVVMGMGGNVGVQSATIAVRGIATGHVQIGGAWKFMFRELRVGVMLGLLYGTLVGTYALLTGRDQPMVGVAVAISIVLATTLGSILGSSVPVALSRFGADPAVATGPFVTSTVDIVGIIVYFNVARVLLGL
jgi:magnesium transporter